MWYLICAQDREKSLAARKSVRLQHIARVEELVRQGRLLLAGPMPAIDSTDPGPAGFTGSMIVAEFDSLDDARAWAREDPYIAAGAWASIDVRPFIKVLP